MLNKKWLTQHQLIVAGVLIIVILVLSFTGQVLLVKHTLLSVSNISIDPQGYEDPATGEWRGSFWTIVMLTDMSDQVGAYKFDKAESEKGINTIGDDKLVPQSKVTIRIDPERPYYERALEVQSGEYSPKCYGGYASKLLKSTHKTGEYVDNLPFMHKEWAVGSWEVHTPFKVTVLKNDVEIGSKTIDTLGRTQTVRIPDTGVEYITITDLGKLGTGYGEPQMGDILFFSKDYIYQADTTSRHYITSPFPTKSPPSGSGDGKLSEIQRNTYAGYWFGKRFWNDDGTPTPRSIVAGTVVISGDDYGGWVDDDTTMEYVRRSVRPVVFPGDKTPEMGAFKSLVEWLDYKGVKRVSKPSWLTKMEITANNKMRLYMPFGSVSSLITIKISTELADTIVWEPLVANFEITDFPDFGDIADRITTSITVKCLEGAGSGTITFTLDDADHPVSTNPPALGTGHMKAGDVKTFHVELLNLGTEEKLEGRLRAGITNALGTETDHAYASYTLLKKTGAETVLTVKTVYQKDESVVTGITITIQYAEQSKSGITDATGQGIITFSLGSYSGVVTVSSASTDVYKAQEVTASVTAGKQTTVILKLYKYDEEEIPWTLIVMVLILVVVVAVAIYMVMARKRKRRR